MGGQEVGTVWGHGAYLAPDWTADWLHREAEFILNKYATVDFNQSFDSINSEQKAALEKRLQNELRKNTFNPQTQTLTVSPFIGDTVFSIGIVTLCWFVFSLDRASTRQTPSK